MREVCTFCGGDAIVGTTCPKAIECPSCHAGAGESCKRPSGHRAAELHVARVAVAEMDSEPVFDVCEPGLFA